MRWISTSTGAGFELSSRYRCSQFGNPENIRNHQPHHMTRTRTHSVLELRLDTITATPKGIMIRADHLVHRQYICRSQPSPPNHPLVDDTCLTQLHTPHTIALLPHQLLSRRRTGSPGKGSPWPRPPFDDKQRVHKNENTPANSIEAGDHWPSRDGMEVWSWRVGHLLGMR